MLMTRNDYGLGLMNGDIGIALKLPERDGPDAGKPLLRVAFPRNDGRGGCASYCRAGSMMSKPSMP